jgi:hypothetical protein
MGTAWLGRLADLVDEEEKGERKNNLETSTLSI